MKNGAAGGFARSVRETIIEFSRHFDSKTEVCKHDNRLLPAYSVATWWRETVPMRFVYTRPNVSGEERVCCVYKSRISSISKEHITSASRPRLMPLCGPMVAHRVGKCHSLDESGVSLFCVFCCVK